MPDFNYIKKAAIAVLGAVVIAVQSFITDGFTTLEWIQLALAAATAFEVWLVTNKTGTPFDRYAKSITAGVLAVLSLIAVQLLDGGEWNTSSIINLVIAFLVAAGVFVVPKPDPELQPPSH